MRSILRFAAALLLSACAATAPAVAPGAPQAGPPPANRVAALLAQAGRADAPTREAIERVIGAADITRQDGVGVALTYRLEHCALLLLFATDAQNAMRLREAHPSARRTGEAAPSLDQCAAEAGARS